MRETPTPPILSSETSATVDFTFPSADHVTAVLVVHAPWPACPQSEPHPIATCALFPSEAPQA